MILLLRIIMVMIYDRRRWYFKRNPGIMSVVNVYHWIMQIGSVPKQSASIEEPSFFLMDGEKDLYS
jgi:hypothetical protein